MMLCGQERDTLAAYLDGELQADQASALEEHLRTCTQCTAEVATMMSMRRALRPARTRFTPSADFRRKIQSQVATKRRSIRPFAGWTIALATLAILLAALVWTRQSALRSDAFREVADLHVGDLASSNPYDVISSDRHTVKPWFQGRIPFSFNLPEFAGTEYTLLGGRLVYLHEQPAAQVVVAVGQHKMTVLIAQETSALGAASSLSDGVAVRDSFNVETWQQHGLRFFVIGDADKVKIERLAQTLKNANQ
jgi:anti-sigma factor RsiW